MKERVVAPTGRAAKGLIATLGRELDGVPEANRAADLELPVVEVKPRWLWGNASRAHCQSPHKREAGLGLGEGVGTRALEREFRKWRW